MSDGILQDWGANSGNLHSRLILVSFRIAQKLHRLPQGVRWLGIPYLGIYQLIAIWLMGIDLSYKASIGPGLRLYHPTGLVIHEAAILGRDCILRQCTTIGMRREASDCPVVGDRVNIGSNSVLIGAITIGNDAVIGAGSIVLHDVLTGDVVAGNPARSIRRKS
ncbi:MAG: serine acetyltransferase [Verrucomicrobia bacterium]|nr:serine acetyltransferase [Verrucomicrobiota bacterium]